MAIYRGAGMYFSSVCTLCTPTLGLWTHTGSTEERPCRRILDDMSIICRQVLAGRVGKGSNETAGGIEKEMREKAEPRYQMEDHKQCMLVKFYRSHPLRRLSPGRRQLRGYDSGWGFCCDSE